MNSKKIRYYDGYDDDFYQTDKKYVLDKDYEYLPKNMFQRLISGLVYGIALVFSAIYCRIVLGVHFVGSEKLRKEKRAFFLYGNHTQPIGDVFDPALACFPKRIYTVVSPANLHLPVIGKLIRPLGGMPLPNTMSGMKKFNSALKERINKAHPIVVYPEAHLWDYYTHIRPFDERSFGYPVKFGVPVYCFTTTYQKRKIAKKPAITIYIDGPFLSECVGKREKAKDLRDKVFENMQARAKMSNYEYIKYIKK